mgnify:CR=1 FL=1
MPGAAWGVIVNGELAHAAATGVRDVASKALVDADTVFRIASMTKSFTAMSILKLRDEGKLSLDDPAERYVPEMKALDVPDERFAADHDPASAVARGRVSRRQLRGAIVSSRDTDDELSQMLRGGIPFSNAPGLAYEYSNYGFAILGRVVSNVSGQRYDDYVAANILRPLGMTSTTLEASKVPADRLAHGYRWEDNQWKEEPLLPHGAFGSMGGMLTSVRDLSRYVGAFLSAWPPRDGPETAPIRRASLREMQQVWRPAPASVTRSSSGASSAQRGRLRVRPPRLAKLRLRPHRRPWRRTAGLWLDHAVAAGLQRRHHRVRQPDLYGVGPRHHRRVRGADEERRVADADAAAIAGADLGPRQGVAPRRSLG